MADEKRIEIKTYPPQVAGGQVSFGAVAIVTRGDSAVASQNIQFFVDGTPQGTPVPTDSNGRTQTVTIVVPAAPMVRVEAQIVGTRFSQAETVSLPVQPAAAVASRKDKLSVRLTTSESGEGIVSVLVADQRGNPIQGVPARFLFKGKVCPETGSLRTDNDGFLSWPVPGHEPGEIVVQVPGFEVEDIRYEGRPRWRKPPALPERATPDLPKNPIARFLQGFLDEMRAQKKEK